MKRICIGLLTALGCIAVATALIVRPFSKKSIQSYVQALLLARTLRGDMELYPPFFWK